MAVSCAAPIDEPVAAGGGSVTESWRPDVESFVGTLEAREPGSPPVVRLTSDGRLRAIAGARFAPDARGHEAWLARHGALFGSETPPRSSSCAIRECMRRARGSCSGSGPVIMASPSWTTAWACSSTPLVI